jgi:hypothetical protein
MQGELVPKSLYQQTNSPYAPERKRTSNYANERESSLEN